MDKVPQGTVVLRRPAARAVSALAALLAASMALTGCRNAADNNGQPSPGYLGAPIADRARLEKLQKAIREKHGLLLRRALQESAVYVKDSPELTLALLARFPEFQGGIEEDRFVAALGAARGRSAEEVVRAYRNTTPERRIFFHRVFGRMGQSAQRVVTLLRHELISPETPSGDQMRIRVVLACAGAANTSEIDEIAKALVTPGKPQEESLVAMLAMGRNQWVNDKIKRSLVAILDAQHADPGNALSVGAGAGVAVMVLGTLGNEASADVQGALANWFNRLSRQRAIGSGVAICALSLARVDPTLRHEALSAALSQDPEAESEPLPRPLCDQFWTLLCIDITDDACIRDVASFLSSQPPLVSRRAAYTLSIIGPRARSAIAGLSQLVESASEEKQGIAAAEALGMVAMPEDVPAIRQVSVKPSLPPHLKRALEDSIRVIELGG